MIKIIKNLAIFLMVIVSALLIIDVVQKVESEQLSKFKVGDCAISYMTLRSSMGFESVKIFYKVKTVNLKEKTYTYDAKGEYNFFYYQEDQKVNMDVFDTYEKTLDTMLCEAMPKYLSPRD